MSEKQNNQDTSVETVKENTTEDWKSFVRNLRNSMDVNRKAIVIRSTSMTRIGMSHHSLMMAEKVKEKINEKTTEHSS